MTIGKMIICMVIGIAIAILHIYREYKWFESLDDENQEYAMNALHRQFKEIMDR